MFIEFGMNVTFVSVTIDEEENQLPFSDICKKLLQYSLKNTVDIRFLYQGKEYFIKHNSILDVVEEI